jgi:hypothetical protein
MGVSKLNKSLCELQICKKLQIWNWIPDLHKIAYLELDSKFAKKER